MATAIVGWAHTPFRKYDDETVESLIVKVANEALDHAGVAASDVDEIVLGHFNAGFSAQDFTASLVLQSNPDFRFKPATRVENACATGSAAVHQGIKTIEARKARIVLVVGVEQMSRTPAEEVGKNLLKASYLKEEADIDGGFAGVFGMIAGAYFQKYGDQSDALARIAAKNHKNGVSNPLAQIAEGSRLRVLPARERQEPDRRRTAEAHRLFAGVGWGGGAGHRGHGDRAENAAGNRLPKRRACAGFSADVEARHPEIRGLRGRLAARSPRMPAFSFPICRSWKRTTVSPLRS